MTHLTAILSNAAEALELPAVHSDTVVGDLARGRRAQTCQRIRRAATPSLMALAAVTGFSAG